MKKSKVLMLVAVGILGVGSIIFGLVGCSEIPKSAPEAKSFIEEVQSETDKSEIAEICEKEVEEEVPIGNDIETEKEENCAVFGSKQIVKPKSSVDQEAEINTTDAKSNEEQPNKTVENKAAPIEDVRNNNSEETFKENNARANTPEVSQSLKDADVVIQNVEVPNPEPQVEIQAMPVPEQPKGHYEERWIVDSPERVIEEPVTTQSSVTICNGCGANITGNLDTHMTEHFITEGAAPSYHDEFEYTTVSQTKVIPEQGHYEQVWVNE